MNKFQESQPVQNHRIATINDTARKLSLVLTLFLCFGMFGFGQGPLTRKVLRLVDTVSVLREDLSKLEKDKQKLSENLSKLEKDKEKLSENLSEKLSKLEKDFLYYKYESLYFEYDKVKRTIIDGLLESDVVRANANNIRNRIATDNIHLKIVKINNPTFKAFEGDKNLFDIIDENINTILIRGLGKNNKAQAINVFQKIVGLSKNVIAQFVNVNPITSAISTIVSVASSHTFYKAEDPEKGKIRELQTIDKNVNAFNNSLDPYIKKYIKLAALNKKASEDINNFKTKHFQLLEHNKSIDSILKSTLKINGSRITEVFKTKYYSKINDKIENIDAVEISEIKMQLNNIKQFLKKTEIKEAYKLLLQNNYIVFKNIYGNINSEYSAILSDFSRESRKVFENNENAVVALKQTQEELLAQDKVRIEIESNIQSLKNAIGDDAGIKIRKGYLKILENPNKINKKELEDLNKKNLDYLKKSK